MLRASPLANAAGKRNNEVTIQIASDGEPNSMGEVNQVYLTSFDRWAEEVITSGREYVAAMAVQPMLNAIVKLPYDSRTKDITSRDRICDHGNIFNISEVKNENNTNEKIVLWCIGVG